MCKIFAMSNVTNIKPNTFRKLLEVINPLITATERDGFGWSAMGAKGVFGERYINPNDFDFRIAYKGNIPKLLNKVCNPEANYFGTFAKRTGPLIVHGRTSTNDRSLSNTHPFTKDDWSLIHNGVVENEGPKYNMESTCDTEHLIHYLTTEGIGAVERYVSGYYAVAAIDPEGALHLFRDSMAPLYIGYVQSIDSFIVATTKDLVSDTCDEMGWKCSPINRMKDNFYMVLKDNELVHSQHINPLGYSSRSFGDKASKAFEGSGAWKSAQWEQYSHDNYDRYNDDKLGYPYNGERLSEKTHEIYDDKGTIVDVWEFAEMSNDNKKRCTIVRQADGVFTQTGDYIDADGLVKIS